jgi:hypothetical protein
MRIFLKKKKKLTLPTNLLFQEILPILTFFSLSILSLHFIISFKYSFFFKMFMF